jgi:DnaK suppressor protein
MQDAKTRCFFGKDEHLRLQSFSGREIKPMTVKEKDILEPSLDALGIEPYKQKKSESYMSDKMLVHFQRILAAFRRRILEGGDKAVTHMKEEAVNYADPNDRASQEEDFRLELRTRDRERKLLKKIEESLEMIREKEYGYCEVCGVEIGLRRLEARPTATLCIDCKTLDEIRERQQKQEEEY